MKFVADVAKVIRTDLAFEHFLDRREEVGQGANHGQRGSVGRTEEATCCRQYQSVLDSFEGYAALMQLGGQQAVGLVHTAGGSRSFALGTPVDLTCRVAPGNFTPRPSQIRA